MEVDLTFVSNAYAPIRDCVAEVNSPLIKKIRVIDIYSGEEGNAITVRLTFSCPDRTLTREEVQQITDTLVEKLAAQGIRMK
jgi:phenylalanyl-tRNA synthetase beta chain